MRITAVNKAPRLVALNTPIKTQINRMKTVENICAPEPIKAEKIESPSGDRNTSP